MLQDGKLAHVGTHELFCPAETDIHPRDEIICDGKRYTVLFVSDAAGRGHHLEVSLEEVQ